MVACGTAGGSGTGGGSGSTTGGGSGSTGGGPAAGGGSVEPIDVTLNEIALSDGDFFELINTSSAVIALSGLRVTDLDDTGGPKEDDALTLPSGTSIAPGALLLFYQGDTAGPSSVCLDASVPSCFTVTFGLSASKGDAIFILDSTGNVLLRADAPANVHSANRSFGRIPGSAESPVRGRRRGSRSGRGHDGRRVIDFDTGLSTDGGAAMLTINEVALNSGDFVEPFNAGTAPIDLSGYLVADLADDGGAKLEDAFTLPSGTRLAPGEFLWLQDSACPDAGVCFQMGFSLSLGSGDGIFVMSSANDAPVLQLTIPPNVHASGKSWGRLADGTGSFTETSRTPGAANAL